MHLAKLAPWIALGLLTGTAAAQDNYLNRTLYLETTWAGYVFGGSTMTGGDALDTLAAGELTDYGIDNVNAPNQQLITGMIWVLQDQDAGTTHQYSLVGYPESAANPGLPDSANPIFNIGPITSPAGMAGQITAWIFTAGFTTPAQAPRESNVYIGMSLPAATSASDILLMQFIDDDTMGMNGPGGTNIYSQPGQSYAAAYPGPITSHLVGIDPSSGIAGFHSRPGSMFVDAQVRGPGGHAMTLSNEAANPAVGTFGGTVTTPHTALYPDATDFNAATPARADSAGYIYQDDQFTTGSIVAVLASLNLNPLNMTAMGGPFPVANIQPGSTGNVCVDFAVNASIGLFFAPTSTGASTPPEQYFELTVPVPAAVPLSAPGIQLVAQGFTLDVASNSVRAGPCSVQTFSRGPATQPMQSLRSGGLIATVALLTAAGAGAAWWALGAPPEPEAPVALPPADEPAADPTPPEPASGPVPPRPAPEAPEAPDDGSLLALPDGTAVPTLNGVTDPIELDWTRNHPYSPIVGKRFGKGPGEWDWYEHADGTLSTTVNVWRSDLGREDSMSLVATPVEGTPVDPGLAQQMFEEGRFGRNPTGGNTPGRGR